jgi:hypothetical protein
MIQLSWWETFIVTAAISLLTVLQTKISNTAEIAALQAAITFLQRLLAGGVGGIGVAVDPKVAQSTTAILD